MKTELKRQHIHQMLSDYGLTVAEWCRGAKMSPNTLYNFLNGHSNDLDYKTIERLSAAININPSDFWQTRPAKLKDNNLKQEKETAAPGFNDVGQLWNLYKAASPDIQEEFDTLHAAHLKKKAASPDKCLDRQTNYGTGNS